MSGAGTVTETERHKAPRHIIHCSDGVLEEYSTDEDDDEVDSANTRPPVDPVISAVRIVFFFILNRIESNS